MLFYFQLVVGTDARVRLLEDVQQKHEEFSFSLSQVDGTIKKLEEKIASHAALGGTGSDIRHIDKIKVPFPLLPKKNHFIHDA